MFEIQKIEELKQDIDKSKSLKDNIIKEIEELEERLQSIESESKQSLIEYKIKKQELEQKLLKLKNEMLNEEALNQEEKNKYIQIENDIKNKISFVSLQNSNIAGNAFDQYKDSPSIQKENLYNQQLNQNYNNKNEIILNDRQRKPSSLFRNDDFNHNKHEKVEADFKSEKKNLRNIRSNISL